MIINHSCTDLESIPAWALQKATKDLHIAYGHTSHGSQIITGMNGLQDQSTKLNGYKGDYYCWDEYHEVYGDNPCLDIDDNFASGDLGHNGSTAWADKTRNYLDNSPVSKDINVVMWSWCGGCSDNTDEGIQTYLDAMNSLEQDYPDITFIYMTGHLDHYSDATLKRNNQLIRDYCINNNKVLFDFADIESYNPDGTYFEFANDDCSYYDSDGHKLGNWATEWQESHVVGKYWYSCYSAHSKPLNANRKAYAAWWMWARIAGWQPNQAEPNFTKHPEDLAICGSSTVEFSVECDQDLELQWQKFNSDDSTFIDLTDNDIYSGVKTKTLQVHVNNLDLSNSKFRCKIVYNPNPIYSETAILIVYQNVYANILSKNSTCSKNIDLKAKNPSPGIGKWDILEGDAVIEDKNSPLTKAKNLSHGDNTFSWIVTNGLCSDSTQITIVKSDSAFITQHPKSINVYSDTIVTFTIYATGDQLSYSWQKDGIDLQNSSIFSGVNSKILIINKTTKDQEGGYHCVVSGICNSTISEDAELKVFTNSIDLISNNIEVYPNPAINTIHIYSAESIDKISLSSVSTGQIILIPEETDAKIIDISSLSTGIYIIRLTLNNNVITKKIIKY